jgi:hypothetical protein
MSTSSLEERMARIEGSVELIGHRLGTLEQDVRAGFERVNNRIDRLEGRMDRWQMGLLGAIAASILATVLSRLL